MQIRLLWRSSLAVQDDLTNGGGNVICFCAGKQSIFLLLLSILWSGMSCSINLAPATARHFVQPNLWQYKANFENCHCPLQRGESPRVWKLKQSQPGNRSFIHDSWTMSSRKSMTMIPHVCAISIISIDLIIRREHSHLCCSRNNPDNFPWQITCVHMSPAVQSVSWAAVYTFLTGKPHTQLSPGQTRGQWPWPVWSQKQQVKVWEDPGPGEEETEIKYVWVCVSVRRRWCGDDIIPGTDTLTSPGRGRARAAQSGV